nr:pecanex-like protein 2 isoform X2 [Aotus nancymaae]
MRLETEPWSTQHIPVLFSAFCGLLVTLSYHLNWQSSDPSVFMSFIQCRLFPKFLHQNLEESAAGPLPKKTKDSVVTHLRSVMYQRASPFQQSSGSQWGSRQVDMRRTRTETPQRGTWHTGLLSCLPGAAL